MSSNISTIFICFFLFTSFQMKSQIIKGTEIIGVWKVETVKVTIPEIPEEQQEIMATLKAAFAASKFTFKTDHTFSFDFQFEDMKIENANWKWDEISQLIIIQDKKDATTKDRQLMGIYPTIENNKMIFKLDESFFELVVKKEK